MRWRMGLWLLSLVGSGLWVHGDVLAFLTQIGFHPSCCLPAADHGALNWKQEGSTGERECPVSS